MVRYHSSFFPVIIHKEKYIMYVENSAGTFAVTCVPLGSGEKIH